MEQRRVVRTEADTVDGCEQCTDTVLMVRPTDFMFNEETARSNPFQRTPAELGLVPGAVRSAALDEFSDMVATLREAGIEVVVLEPAADDELRPDAVFPNNWFSHHRSGNSGLLILYPLLSQARRRERRAGALLEALSGVGIHEPHVWDITEYENGGEYLEGTGSLVLDRVKKVAFAVDSPRTSSSVLDHWCALTGYRPVRFHAADSDGVPIYHTNVVMAIGSTFAVICAESIPEPVEREMVLDELRALGKEVVLLSYDELTSFCGNLLEVRTRAGKPRIILSAVALRALTPENAGKLSRHGELLPVRIDVIERIGGGSARCMLAEVFPVRESAS